MKIEGRFTQNPDSDKTESVIVSWTDREQTKYGIYYQWDEERQDGEFVWYTVFNSYTEACAYLRRIRPKSRKLPLY